jgi:flagellar basal body rod protein FlgG
MIGTPDNQMLPGMRSDMTYYASNAKALYQAGSLMSKINAHLAGNQKNTNLAEEMVDQIKRSSNAEAQANTIRTIDEMVGSQLDLIA